MAGTGKIGWGDEPALANDHSQAVAVAAAKPMSTIERV